MSYEQLEARAHRLEGASHAAFLAMCAFRDNGDAEIFQDAIDALGTALSDSHAPAQVPAVTEDSVHSFVQSYQFDASDEGFLHTPSEHEKAMIEDAINSFLAEAALSRQAPAVTRPERVQAAFDVWRQREETGPNATALFEYIEQLEAALSRPLGVSR